MKDKLEFSVTKTPITRSFETGAVRGDDKGRGKPSLLPFEAVSMVSRCFRGSAFMPMAGLLAIARVYEAGTEKYEARNWENGIPFSAYVDSAIRHFGKFQRGDRDEPHCGQFAWNLMCLLQTYLWANDGKFNSSANIADMPAVNTDAAKMRKEPLPIINMGSMSLHATMAMGSLFGFCYGSHPINLPAAVGHSMMLCHIHCEADAGRAGYENLSDMELGWAGRSRATIDIADIQAKLRTT